MKGKGVRWREIQTGVVRRLWGIILARGQRSGRRQRGQELTVSNFRGMTLNATINMNIIRKQWFLDVTGKCVFPLGHCAVETMVLLKLDCLAHIFLDDFFFSVCWIKPDKYWILKSDSSINVWDLTWSCSANGVSLLSWKCLQFYDHFKEFLSMLTKT